MRIYISPGGAPHPDIVKCKKYTLPGDTNVNTLVLEPKRTEYLEQCSPNTTMDQKIFVTTNISSEFYQ